MTDLDLCKGDRIELISMAHPCPLPEEIRGTVTSIFPCRTGHQIDVEWDNGRSLMLALPYDKYKLLERSER